MTVALLIASAALVLAAVTLAVVLWRTTGIDRLVRRRVVVHTRDERSIRGVLTATHTDCLVLEAAEYLDGGNATKLPGQAVLPRANVAWLQTLPAEAA